MSYAPIRLAAASLVLASFAGAAHAGPWQSISIDGYFSLEYEHAVSGDVNDGDPNGSLDMDGLDLVINAQPDPRVRMAADITFEHGPATEENLGNVAVEYAFGEYTVEDWLRLRAGKMFIHFGIYNDFHTAKPAFLSVKEPYAVGRIDKMGSESGALDLRFFPRWGTGIAALGEFDLGDMPASYVVQLTNGHSYTVDEFGNDQPGYNPYEDDENDHKAFSGRFRLSPTDDLRLGLSVYTDKAGEFGAFCSGIDDDDCGAVVDPSTGEFTIETWGLEAEWQVTGDWALQSEYVQGNIRFDDDASLADFDQDRVGWYLQASRRLTPALTGYARYESFDPDDSLSDDEMDISVLGVNWLVAKGAHLKFEFDRYASGDVNGELGGNGYTELKAAFAVGF